MRHYEIVLLVHPSRSEQVPSMLHRYKDLVRAAKGKVHRVEDWGRRRLAYMIAEVHKAHYVMLNVECELDTLRELEKNFQFNDSIVRSLVIRRARALTEQTYMAKAKIEEDRLEAEKLARAEAAAKEAEAKEAAAAMRKEIAGGESDDSVFGASEEIVSVQGEYTVSGAAGDSVGESGDAFAGSDDGVGESGDAFGASGDSVGESGDTSAASDDSVGESTDTSAAADETPELIHEEKS